MFSLFFCCCCIWYIVTNIFICRNKQKCTLLDSTVLRLSFLHLHRCINSCSKAKNKGISFCIHFDSHFVHSLINNIFKRLALDFCLIYATQNIRVPFFFNFPNYGISLTNMTEQLPRHRGHVIPDTGSHE